MKCVACAEKLTENHQTLNSPPARWRVSALHLNYILGHLADACESQLHRWRWLPYKVLDRGIEPATFK